MLLNGAGYESWLAEQTLDVEEGYWMVNTYALAWARAHVLGDKSADILGLVEGTTELDPRATFQKK